MRPPHRSADRGEGSTHLPLGRTELNWVLLKLTHLRDLAAKDEVVSIREGGANTEKEILKKKRETSHVEAPPSLICT